MLVIPPWPRFHEPFLCEKSWTLVYFLLRLILSSIQSLQSCKYNPIVTLTHTDNGMQLSIFIQCSSGAAFANLWLWLCPLLYVHTNCESRRQRDEKTSDIRTCFLKKTESPAAKTYFSFTMTPRLCLTLLYVNVCWQIKLWNNSSNNSCLVVSGHSCSSDCFLHLQSGLWSV